MKTILTCATLFLLTPGFSIAYFREAPKPDCGAPSEPQKCLSPSYNAAAAIDVRHKMGKTPNLSYYLDGAFTYWYAGEEGLKLASNGVLDSGTFFFAQESSSLYQSSNYAPGFKVEAGIIGHHEWVFDAAYTWYRGTNKTGTKSISGVSPTAGVAVSTAISGTDVWVVDDWFLQGTASGQALAGSAIASKWHLALDLIDAAVGRPFYQGTKLTISPFAGLRAAFIRQAFTLYLTESTELFGVALQGGSEPVQPITSRNHSNSWGIGPRFGLGAKSLLPKGFRFEGDLAASLLYTNYTSLKHSEGVASTAFNPGPYTTSIKNYSSLRPIAELGLGIGWGKYFRNRDYHLDISADYDFMLFWSQNMMRKLLDDTLTGTSPAPAELYLHGLTVTARFDF